MDLDHFGQGSAGWRFVFGLRSEMPKRFKAIRADGTINPFGHMSAYASRVSGIGGPKQSPDPHYVFRTREVATGHGMVRFIVKFADFGASTGVMLLEVTNQSRVVSGNPVRLYLRAISLPELVLDGGQFVVEIMAHANMTYALGGFIHGGTDASASGLTIRVEHNLPPDLKARRRRLRRPAARGRIVKNPVLLAVSSARLFSFDLPSFSVPTSQYYSIEQTEAAAFAECVQELGLTPGENDSDVWGEAFILQTLLLWGALTPLSRGIGMFSKSSGLCAALASRGNRILAVNLSEDVAERNLGIELEALGRPELCDPDWFRRCVDFCVLSADAVPRDRFDFGWAIASADDDRAAMMALPVKLASAVKIGGVGVAIVSARLDQPMAGNGNDRYVSRQDLERMTVDLVSRGNLVSQLRFPAVGASDDRVAVPFALIIQRRS